MRVIFMLYLSTRTEISYTASDRYMGKSETNETKSVDVVLERDSKRSTTTNSGQTTRNGYKCHATFVKKGIKVCLNIVRQ